jgi:manganese oxidase
VKVRDGIDADDYSDPGWYENPPGEMAYEWTGELPEFASNNSPKTILTPKPNSKG